MTAENSPTQPMVALSKFTLSEESLYTKGELINSIQQNIIALFQRKVATQKTLSQLHAEVQSLLATEAGQFLCQFYEERVLKKGMWLLREEFKGLDMLNLLVSIADCWNYFYTETLPRLQAIMIHVPTKSLTIRQITLLAFRDEMLLKTLVQPALMLYVNKNESKSRNERSKADDNPDDVRAALVQMFLVLLSVNKQMNEKYLQLEEMASMLITPLVTPTGIYYEGRCSNVIKISREASIKRVRSAGDLLDKSFKSNRQPRRGASSAILNTPSSLAEHADTQGTSPGLASTPRSLSRLKLRLGYPGLLLPLHPVEEVVGHNSCQANLLLKFDEVGSSSNV